MKQGDLVKPLGSCGGRTGAKRCNIAVVLEPHADKYLTKIVCPCGAKEVYRAQLEAIETTYSADPM